MTAYLCSVCGTLASPTNSNLVEGNRFVHRACQEQPQPDRTHSFFCADDGCRGECQAGLYVDLYGDPLQDREPMGGDPFWAEERDL